MMSWLKQPTTLMAVAIVIAGAVYWFTGNAALAGGAAAVVLGGISDQTKDVLARVESVEDTLKQAGTTNASAPK